jgi:hypothetical protein
MDAAWQTAAGMDNAISKPYGHCVMYWRCAQAVDVLADSEVG